MSESSRTVDRQHHRKDDSEQSVRSGAGHNGPWNEAARAAYKQAYENPSANRTDTTPQHHVTDLQGKACKADIKDGQAPMLLSGSKAKGCDFKNLKDGKIDMPSIYEQAQKQAFHIEAHGTEGTRGFGAASGSGVAVGKDGNACFVATDDHVVGGVNNFNPEHMWAQKDNQSFPAKKIWNDPKHDLALLKVDMGEHPELCQPGTIAEHPDLRQQAVGAGYPQDSNALTLSPGRLQGSGTQERVLGPSDPKLKIKTDPHRTVILSDANSLEGQSGGPFYNKNKEIVGLLGGGFPGATDFTFINPLNRRQMEEAIARHRND